MKGKEAQEAKLKGKGCQEAKLKGKGAPEAKLQPVRGCFPWSIEPVPGIVARTQSVDLTVACL